MSEVEELTRINRELVQDIKKLSRMYTRLSTAGFTHGVLCLACCRGGAHYDDCWYGNAMKPEESDGL